MYADKRVFTRIPHFQEVQCNEMYRTNTIMKNVNCKLTILNISLGGIGAVTTTELKKDDIIVFFVDTDICPQKTMCRVTRCEKKDFMYFVGLEFINISQNLSKYIKHLQY